MSFLGWTNISLFFSVFFAFSLNGPEIQVVLSELFSLRVYIPDLSKTLFTMWKVHDIYSETTFQ